MKFKAEFKEIDGEKYFKFNNEFDRIRYYHSNLILVSLAIVMISMMALLLMFVFNHVDEMQTNPFVYGLSKLEVETQCVCIPDDPNYRTFFVNSTEWWMEGLYTSYNWNPNLLNITIVQDDE